MIGPQGSGKSTQAELLAQFLTIPRISTGDIFRQLSQENSEIGGKLRQILESGQLVDDETTAKIVQERLEREDCQEGFILDGYPRNLEQLKLSDPKVEKVFYLKVAEDEVVKRMRERGRADDTPEAIKKRLDLYYLQTQPLLDYYKKAGILEEVDGSGSIDQIQARLRQFATGK